MRNHGPFTFKRVGEVLVDSGHLILIDPCYMIGFSEKDYDSQTDLLFPEGSMSRSKPTEMMGGITFPTTCGDGVYQVYEMSRGDTVIGMLVDFEGYFDPQEDEDE